MFCLSRILTTPCPFLVAKISTVLLWILVARISYFSIFNKVRVINVYPKCVVRWGPVNIVVSSSVQSSLNLNKRKQKQLVIVTGRSGAGFALRGHAVTQAWGVYFLPSPRSTPVRGLTTLLPWPGPRFSPPKFYRSLFGAWLGWGLGQR